MASVPIAAAHDSRDARPTAFSPLNTRGHVLAILGSLLPVTKAIWLFSHGLIEKVNRPGELELPRFRHFHLCTQTGYGDQ